MYCHGFIKGICMDRVDAIGKEGKDVEQVAMIFWDQKY
jgi:hypothetical protein